MQCTFGGHIWGTVSDVSINYLEYISRFWSSHPQRTDLFGPWLYGTFWHCMDQDNKMTDICPKKRFWYQLFAIFDKRLKQCGRDIRHFTVLICRIHAMTECSIIRVQKDSLFRDGCSRGPESWNIFMKVNIDQILTYNMQHIIKNHFKI